MRIRIRAGQKHADPADPDPKPWKIHPGDAEFLRAAYGFCSLERQGYGLTDGRCTGRTRSSAMIVSASLYLTGKIHTVHFIKIPAHSYRVEGFIKERKSMSNRSILNICLSIPTSVLKQLKATDSDRGHIFILVFTFCFVCI